jgi:exopolysaccharide biosynthesis polyprenyl glycosylphosphotransferase
LQLAFQFIADLFAIWVGFALQLYLRFFSGMMETIAQPNINDYILGSTLMTIFWVVVFAVAGMYKNWHLRSPFAEFFAVIKTVFFASIILVLALILILKEPISFRVLILTYAGIMWFLFTIFRYTARRLQVFLRIKRIIKIPAILVGTTKHCIAFYEKTQKSIAWGFEVIGFVLIEEINDNTFEQLENSGIPRTMILGTVEEFPQIISNLEVEEIIITEGTPNSRFLFKIESICSSKKIRTSIEPNLYDHFTGRTKTQNIYGIPLIEIEHKLMKPLYATVKRLFDIVFSLSVLVVGMPIWFLTAIIIKLESKGKALYSQPRVGLNNAIFTIYKFRSMAQTECADPENPQWTKVGDPRVTKFGKFMRKSHLDEVPQFYNVLIGDMSIIGPRPEQPKFVEEFASQLTYYNRRHLVKPGITGWWQVKYKSHILDLDEIKSRTKDDFYYIENMSLQLDFEIMVRTVWCVLKGHGKA